MKKVILAACLALAATAAVVTSTSSYTAIDCERIDC